MLGACLKYSRTSKELPRLEGRGLGESWVGGQRCILGVGVGQIMQASLGVMRTSDFTLGCDGAVVGLCAEADVLKTDRYLGKTVARRLRRLLNQFR